MIRRGAFRLMAVMLCTGSTSACRDDRAGSGAPNDLASATVASQHPAANVSSAVAVSAAPASAVPAPTPSAAIPATPPSASNEHREDTDFEDGFAYGSADPAVAASAGLADASKLASRVTYESYFNARFGFELDVPRAFRAMPEPTNGDGMQWRLGTDAIVTASGMYASEDVPLACANSKNVTAHSETKRACWATGKRSGFIYWERQRLDHDVVYSLRFQYRESLKERMAPIVEHVNASWKI